MKIGIDKLSCAIETLRQMERSAVAVAERARRDGMMEFAESMDVRAQALSDAVSVLEEKPLAVK